MATWSKLDSVGRSVTAQMALTESAPVDQTEGIALDVEVIVPILHAPVGQTFTGGSSSGTLVAYFYHKTTGWVRVPRLDDDLTDCTGLSIVRFQPIVLYTHDGQFALMPSGVLVSGGTVIQLDLIATLRASLR